MLSAEEEGVGSWQGRGRSAECWVLGEEREELAVGWMREIRDGSPSLRLGCLGFILLCICFLWVSRILLRTILRRTFLTLLFRQRSNACVPNRLH